MTPPEFTRRTTVVNPPPPPPHPHRSMVEALGTSAKPDELFAILAGRFGMVCEDGTALTLENHLGRKIHSFLAHLASGVDPITGLDRVALIGVDQDGMGHLMHLLLSVPANL